MCRQPACGHRNRNTIFLIRTVARILNDSRWNGEENCPRILQKSEFTCA